MAKYDIDKVDVAIGIVIETMDEHIQEDLLKQSRKSGRDIRKEIQRTAPRSDAVNVKHMADYWQSRTKRTPLNINTEVKQRKVSRRESFIHFPNYGTDKQKPQRFLNDALEKEQFEDKVVKVVESINLPDVK